MFCIVPPESDDVGQELENELTFDWTYSAGGPQEHGESADGGHAGAETDLLRRQPCGCDRENELENQDRGNKRKFRFGFFNLFQPVL